MKAAKTFFGAFLLTVTFADQVTAQSFLTNGLAAYYPLRGNSFDESGYGHNLTNHGAALCPDRFGVVNRAYSFDGNSYLGSSVAPLTQTDDWTVSAWVQLATLDQAAADAVCVGYDNGTNGDGFGMGVSGIQADAIWTATNELWVFFPGLVFVPVEYQFDSTSEWYQLVIVRDTGILMVYVNGEPVPNYEPTLSSAVLTPTALEVGSGGTSRFFNGAVDDVRVYNRSLSSTEVQNLYNYEAGTSQLPFIILGPANEIFPAGGTATLLVNAAASMPLSYQWTFDGMTILGATNATLSLTNLQPTQAGTYGVIVSDSYEAVPSSDAVLTVAVAPIIESQPDSQLVSAGQSLALSVTAVGPRPLLYQWTYNGTDIAFATDSTLVLTDVGTNQTGNYDVVVSNIFGSVISSNAVLTVDVPPRIKAQPQSQGVLPGANAAFSVAATGLPLSFQWLMNNSPIAGQTGFLLALTNVSGSNDGQYDVIISNAVGVVTSIPVALDVEYGTAFLDPSAFASLGTFNPSNNVVVDESSGVMTGGVSFAGLRVKQNGNDVLVFAFSNFTLNAYVNITFTNFASNVIVAVLSQGDMTIGGIINDSGGGVGGYAVGGSASNDGGGGGGGGFGGSGGAGEWGAAGGGTYNVDLTSEIGFGSAGGNGAWANLFGEGTGLGGDGGGALQLAVNGLLTLRGSVQVDGLAGRFASGLPDANSGGGGGGSGGGLLIQAGDVNITQSGMLFARGGQGGPSSMYTGGGPTGAQQGGGGGGGGRIVVAYLNTGVNNGTLVATGGDGGGPLVSGENSGNGADGTAGTIVFGRNPTIPAFPRLAGSLDSVGNVILSWPISATNYVLQTSDSLTPSAVWATLETAAPSGESIVFSNQASGVSAFFRLRHN